MLISIRLILLLFITRINQIIRVIFAIALNQISYYPKSVKTFESDFKKETNSLNSLMFSNATSAMEAALFACNVNDKSKVGSTAFVIPSSYAPACCLGAKIKFIDIDQDTLNLDISNLEKLDCSIDVLIVTHFYGNPCDMELIMNWAKEKHVYVIEDCSHAHGASFKGKKLGSWGHVGIFSLQGAKAIAAGEGAVAITNDSELMIKMAAYGHQESYKKFSISTEKEIKLPSFGYGKKMRVHPLGAVLAKEELKRIDKKNSIFLALHQELVKLSQINSNFKIPKVIKNGQIGGFCQGVPLIIKNEDMAKKIKKALIKNRISCFTRDYTLPLIEFSDTFNNSKDIKDSLPNSYSNFSKVIFVPFYQFVSPIRWKRLKSILKNYEDV